MSVARVMPEQKPGRSEQVVCTPDDFLDAFEHRFGPIVWDLAATRENAVLGLCVCYFGPGSVHGENSLNQSWARLPLGNLWLNPEFGQAADFARKSYEEGQKGAQVNLFLPLSSSNWARDYCWGKAMVYPLNPRIVFKGHKSAYPKDMMLVRYGVNVGCELWRWK